MCLTKQVTRKLCQYFGFEKQFTLRKDDGSKGEPRLIGLAVRAFQQTTEKQKKLLQ